MEGVSTVKPLKAGRTPQRRYFIAEGLVNPTAWQPVTRERFLRARSSCRHALRTGNACLWEDFRFATVKG